MASHPETLRIVQTVHDTVHHAVQVVVHDTVRVAAHDTVVRVAEPLHEAVRSGGFFGPKSPFDIIVAVVALLSGGYTLFTLLQRPRVKLHLGDHVGVIFNPDGDVGRKLHLRCNFVNSAVKMGTVHHLEAFVEGPENFVARFRWHLFYKYERGGHEVAKTSDVYPLAVAGRDSHVEFIEFEVAGLAPRQRLPWVGGRYTVTVEGWVNRKHRLKAANLRTVCHFTLADNRARDLREQTVQQAQFLAFPVEEWTTPTR